MTSDKDLKRVVRARMRKTGESYTAARAQVVKKPRTRTSTPPTPLPRIDHEKLAGMADAKVQLKTGRTWAEWVRLLDADGIAALPHREMARHIREKYDTPDWWTQTVTVGYERIKGLRERGQRRDGTYEVNKSRTVAAPVTTAFDAWHDTATRRRWLEAKDVTVRTASRPRAMRLGWNDGSVVVVGFTAKGRKTSVAVQHAKLPDRDTAERLKQYWTDRLDGLAKLLEN